MYERFYSLDDRPFRLTPDPGYLYLGEQHSEAMAHLRYGLEEASGFIAVTGAIGTGKTTLLRALLKEMRSEFEVAYIFNPVLTTTELLQTVNAEFGLVCRSTSRKELTEALNAFLVECKRKGGRVVVVVDEAQNLSPRVLEQLRLLSNLETETEKLLQIVLLGQPELRSLLSRPELAQLAQRITVRWHLEPLGRSDTHAYVSHRLSVAGASEEIFDAEALDLIHDHASGVPRLINILCHRSLLVAYTRAVARVGQREVAVAVLELEHGRVPLAPRKSSWSMAAVVGGGGVAAAVAVAFVLLGPLGRSNGPTPEARPRPMVAAVAVEGPRHSVALLAETLSASPAYEQTVAAVSGLLGLWQKDGLGSVLPDRIDLEKLANRRGLGYIAASVSHRLLEILDLPALVELSAGDDGIARYVLVEALGRDQATLRVGTNTVEVAGLDSLSLWNGHAHLLWDDRLEIGGTVGAGSKGPGVKSLQVLLSEAGVYSGKPSGVYDEATENAVRGFQAELGVEPDGEASVVTQIALYNAASRGPRPSLRLQ